MDRDISTVIDNMLQVIPESEGALRDRLSKIKQDSGYHPLEEQQECWMKASLSLKHFVPAPKEEWHIQMLSIFSEQPEETLRTYWLGDPNPKVN